MKFKFSNNLEYQTQAVESITGLFEYGRASMKQDFEMQHSPATICNMLTMHEPSILENLQEIQKQNKIEEGSEKLEGLDFSIEMETGTGKTYVYLKTIFELHARYNLKKFIILVPSVAIREWVLKTLEQTQEHFRTQYDAFHHYFAYESKKLSLVRDFVQGDTIQIMVMTIQSFNKDSNVLKIKQDRFQGVPLKLIAETRPVVIMDEPQNMESDLSKSAIGELNPLFKLRYSATHKNSYNLCYRLSPVDAYNMGLVKKIEVSGVEDTTAGDFVFKIKNFDGLKATVELEILLASGEYVYQDVILKNGDNLFRKTKNNPKYEGLSLVNMDARFETIELSDGREFKKEATQNLNVEQIFRTQIRETILCHTQKQEKFWDSLKVLSLFFIDAVDNYVNDGFIKKIFEEEYTKIHTKFPQFAQKQAHEVHNGYFSKKTKKTWVEYLDTKGDSQDDKATYDLIMKDKEKLLSFSENLCFIFSHSALREGWDNPNVFQICTLANTSSISLKRQIIGRGLRLPVDTQGKRINDPSINILTVIPNESYESFAGNLQKEYEQAGYKKVPKANNARERVTVKFNKAFAAENAYFKELWKRISQKTRYELAFSSIEVVKKSIEKINELDVNNLVIKVRSGNLRYDEKTGKIEHIFERENSGYTLSKEIIISNILERIVKETSLTKKSAFEILMWIENLDLVFDNPEEFQRSIIICIKAILEEIIINEWIQYIPKNDIWKLDIFHDTETFASKILKVQNEKSPFDAVIFDGEWEREFAKNLEVSPRVKIFTKLPAKFLVETPLWSYNPDWAIVIQENYSEALYLMRETKFDIDFSELRVSEKKKILCGKKHFESIGVDFKVSQSQSLRDII